MTTRNSKQAIATNAAPGAIGTYSQAIKAGNTCYLSGQIPLAPDTMELVSNNIAEQAEQVFRNLAGVAEACGGTLNDCVKLTVYLTDLGDFQTCNEVMARHVSEPYPARAAVQVSALPRGAQIEIDAVLVLP